MPRAPVTGVAESKTDLGTAGNGVGGMRVAAGQVVTLRQVGAWRVPG